MYCACHAICMLADPFQTSHARHRFFWKCCKTHAVGSLLTRRRMIAPATEHRTVPSKSVPELRCFSTCASHHSRVHIFKSSTSKTDPRMKCFSILASKTFGSLGPPDGSAPAALVSLLFDPLDPPIIEKHSELRLFYLFVHLHLLAFDSFSSLIFFSSSFVL